MVVSISRQRISESAVSDFVDGAPPACNSQPLCVSPLAVLFSMGTVASVQYQLASVPMIGSRFFIMEMNVRFASCGLDPLPVLLVHFSALLV